MINNMEHLQTRLPVISSAEDRFSEVGNDQLSVPLPGHSAA